MMDDFYNFKWNDDDQEKIDEQEKIDNKLSDDQQEKTNSILEIINFFENNSLIEQKEIDWRVKKIG
jgi:hypothetical protein